MKACFDHERLVVYQESIRFVAWTAKTMESLPKSLAACDQLERASTSIPLNIAEGNGRNTSRDRCHFFDNARGSTLECAACLDVLVAQRKLNSEDVLVGKEMLGQIVSMLVGLIRSNSPDRMHDALADYEVNVED
jgi:four helix bundle protein